MAEDEGLYAEILTLSRQAGNGGLAPWFDRRLRQQIGQGLFLDEARLGQLRDRVIAELSDYRQQAGIGTAVLGMSGGVDSALTAALFKKAGWRVIGFTLPIHQNPEETERGVEACQALGLEHIHVDLSPEYEAMVAGLGKVDETLSEADTVPARTRRGNLRARLRMMTLYDQAHRFGGLVASTDNFSELGAGFWTLHGDVGDLAPVQGLIKSWEIPWLARAVGVPEKTWRAKPTDGLGIGAGDEAQIGATYLEWDIMIFALAQALQQAPRARSEDLAALLEIGDDAHARKILDTVLARLRMTWHKRINPIRLDHPLADRFALLDRTDEALFRPTVLQRDEAALDFPASVHAVALDLCRRLEECGLRAVTAESCTGGLLGASLAAVPGSSKQLEGSFVTYCESLKVQALGVSQDVIRERTVYDPEVARQMAAGALAAAPEAGLAMATTGVAGPDPDQGKPAGYVCIAAALRGHDPVAREFTFQGGPQAVIAQALSAALEMGLAALPRDGKG